MNKGIKLTIFSAALLFEPILFAAEQNGQIPSRYLANTILTLIFVIAAVLVVAYIIKKMTKFKNINNPHLKVVGSLMLGTKERILIVEHEQKKLVLGVTPHTINTLHVSDVKKEDSQT